MEKMVSPVFSKFLMGSQLNNSENWLGDLDSNQDSQIQNLESYRWTISHPLRGQK
jgi:hypothetical protein